MKIYFVEVRTHNLDVFKSKRICRLVLFSRGDFFLEGLRSFLPIQL